MIYPLGSSIFSSLAIFFLSFIKHLQLFLILLDFFFIMAATIVENSSPSMQSLHFHDDNDEETGLWSRIRKRAKFLNGDEDTDQAIYSPQFLKENEESESCKRNVRRQDTELLHKGFEALVSTVCNLSHTLSSAVQEGAKLAETNLSSLLPLDPPTPPSTTKRLAKSESTLKTCKDNEENRDACSKIQEHRQLAASMATKAKFLEKELKAIRADLVFTRERCALLEEENTMLREEGPCSADDHEDELVRLQLEALLAEKSRLAQENADLRRENECLHQAVQYHKLTLQDMDMDMNMNMNMVADMDFSSPTEEELQNEIHSQSPFYKVLNFSDDDEIEEPTVQNHEEATI